MAKRALIIGVNDYRNWHRATPLSFPDLRWCRADATSFATLLTDGFGFAPANVTLCEDAEATRQAILDGVTTLLSGSQPGDVVCFFYAGHGGRVAANGWGRPSDRYYETIVPYDGAMISDWEITSIAQALELSRVNFTIVLDSCHSGGLFDPPEGTAIRTYNWTDRMIEMFVSACRTILPFICSGEPEALAGNISNPRPAGRGVTMTVDPSKDASRQAKATLLSACNYNETAGESTRFGHGYFTNAILDTVKQSNFLMDHPKLLAELRRKVTGYSGGTQTPQLRGRPVRLEENFLAEWTFSI